MESEKDIYKRDGFIVLRDFFNESQTKEILNIADYLFDIPEERDSYMKYYETVDGKRTLSRIEKFYDFEPRVMWFINTLIKICRVHNSVCVNLSSNKSIDISQ